jgi:eukaryotic-like serine/threonine-protein kinase
MGEIIGKRYRIIRSLGRGGMGEIFLAEDIKLGRKVAVKCISWDSSSAGYARSRFRDEARAAARLDHPNICKIYEIGEDNEKEFIVMQFIDGVTLGELLKMKPLSSDKIIGIALQITKGMIAAQAQHIVHLDIKPANIMIDKSGTVKILDFGLAEFRPRRSADRKAPRPGPGVGEEGVVMGTASYISPEQAEGRDPDGRSDIYSLGVVLYEMIEHRNPFTADEDAVTLYNILHCEVRFSRQAPAALRAIVQKALHKDRERRYRDFSEIEKDLAAVKCSLDQSREGMANLPNK